MLISSVINLMEKLDSIHKEGKLMKKEIYLLKANQFKCSASLSRLKNVNKYQSIYNRLTSQINEEEIKISDQQKKCTLMIAAKNKQETDLDFLEARHDQLAKEYPESSINVTIYKRKAKRCQNDTMCSVTTNPSSQCLTNINNDDYKSKYQSVKKDIEDMERSYARRIEEMMNILNRMNSEYEELCMKANVIIHRKGELENILRIRECKLKSQLRMKSKADMEKVDGLTSLNNGLLAEY